MKKDSQTKKFVEIADIQSGGTHIVTNDKHSILHTPCAELPRSPARMFIATSDECKRRWFGKIVSNSANEGMKTLANVKGLLDEI